MEVTAAWVVLTQGDRSHELRRAIESIQSQAIDAPDVVVVSNGAGEIELPEGVRLVVSRENRGIPGGRNVGAANTDSDVIFFLDDDARYGTSDVAPAVLAAFHADPSLGIVSLRITDPDTGGNERRHVPRLRVGDPAKSSAVTSFLGGACAIRRDVFAKCGAYSARFFYGHEESDLAWRAIDNGFSVQYRGDLVVHHAAAPAARHPEYHYQSGRNRVWLARRRLPWPVAIPHVTIWTLRSLWNAGSGDARRQVLKGFRAGWREDAGKRRPISWATVWKMTRLGRPPIL